MSPVSTEGIVLAAEQLRAQHGECVSRVRTLQAVEQRLEPRCKVGHELLVTGAYNGDVLTGATSTKELQIWRVLAAQLDEMVCDVGGNAGVADGGLLGSVLSALLGRGVGRRRVRPTVGMVL